MVNLIFLIGLNINPVSCDEYGDWIMEELQEIVSDEEGIVTYCGELNEWITEDK